MAFDPSKIKRVSEKKAAPSLAEMLLERGLASSLTAAQRLADGMVETEKKVMQDTVEPEPVRDDAFQKFVTRAATIDASKITAPAQAEPVVPKQTSVIFEEAPDTWSPVEDGYVKTEIDASEDGVVARHVETTEKSHTEVEEGIIRADEEDLAKENGVDMFDIFNANK